MIADYDEALRQTAREAKATLVCALLLACFFGVAIWLLKDLGLGPAGLPYWFWAAVAGGYFLSIAGVLWLVKVVFRNFSLDLRPVDQTSDETSLSANMSESAATRQEKPTSKQTVVTSNAPSVLKSSDGKTQDAQREVKDA